MRATVKMDGSALVVSDVSKKPNPRDYVLAFDPNDTNGVSGTGVQLQVALRSGVTLEVLTNEAPVVAAAIVVLLAPKSPNE